MENPKQFYIFGQGISQSQSPTIHNAGFKYHGLPHRYSIQESRSIDDVVTMYIDSEDFGGASVTMPHKLSVQSYCQEQSDAAVRIGAVNTLVVVGDEKNNMKTTTRKKKIRGENTDWSGLYSIVAEYLSSNGVDDSGSKTGLVIGAGGAGRAAIYAMYRAGLERIYLWNRTVSKAQKVSDDFCDLCGVTVVGKLSEISQPPDVIIGTVPAHVSDRDWFSGLFAGSTGLCIEMSYKPRMTPLIVAAQDHVGWMVADGLEVLLRQAFAQYELWTGREAPEAIMRKAVRDATGDDTGMFGRSTSTELSL